MPRKRATKIKPGAGTVVIPSLDLNRLIKVETAGEGTYGIVYTAKSVLSTVAVKRNLIEQSTDFTGSIKELDILYRLRGHPNIVTLMGVSFGDPFVSSGGHLSPLKTREYKDDTIHFIFEHAIYDLHTLIHQSKPSPAVLISALVQMLLGLEYMHAKGVIHRDLKPSNVLVFMQEDGGMVFKLCDFGLAKPFTHQGAQSPKIVTPWYRAPEICFGWPDYGMESDLWSMGCILFEMLAKKALMVGVKSMDGPLIKALLNKVPTPVTDGDLDDLLKRQKRKNYTRTQLERGMITGKRKTWAQQMGFDAKKAHPFERAAGLDFTDLMDLVDGLLQVHPRRRLTASQALTHPALRSSREHIDMVHKAVPPTAAGEGRLDVVDTIERRWMTRTAFSIFNQRDKLGWYNHRILFQAMDIFDRYLVWATQRAQTGEMAWHPEPSEDRGHLHTRYETELRFTVCVYISIKYFSSLTIPISYKELASKEYNTPEARVVAEDFEVCMLRDCLQFGIYRDTVYEISDAHGDLLDDDEVRDLIMVQGMTTSYNGMSPQELYQLYKAAR